MKKRQKGCVAALLFSAAMNLNGCIYGPPPESEAAPGHYDVGIATDGEDSGVSLKEEKAADPDSLQQPE